MLSKLTNIIKSSKILIYLFFLLSILLLWLMVIAPIHEGSHAIVCKLMGAKPILQIFPHPSINCDIGGKSQFSYFLLLVIPFILYLFLTFLIFYKLNIINKKFTFIFMTSILLDLLWNYFLSPFYNTDFKNIANLSKFYSILSTILVILLIVFGISILRKSWQEIMKTN